MRVVQSRAVDVTGRWMVGLIAAALNGQAMVCSGHPDWQGLTERARAQAVEPLVWRGLVISGIVPTAEDAQALKQACVRQVALEASQAAAQAALFDALEQDGVPFAPLKGCALRPLYPEPSLRPMNDLDLLADPADAQRIEEIVSGLGYQTLSTGMGNTGEYALNGIVKLEVHVRLFSETVPGRLSAPLSGALERARPAAQGGARRELRPEDHYPYLLAHMYKHYRTSGSGVRPLADVWLYLRAHGSSMDWDETRRTLEDMGLTDFERKVAALAGALFGGREPEPELSDLADFLMSGGLFGAPGTREINRALTRCPRGGAGALINAFFAAVFPGPGTLSAAFPVLRRWPVLLPLCWAARWAKALAFKRERLRLIPALFSARTRAQLKKNRGDSFE